MEAQAAGFVTEPMAVLAEFSELAFGRFRSTAAVRMAAFQKHRIAAGGRCCQMLKS